MVINHDVKIEGTIRPIFNKIVMIMDESVRGDYVSLNDATHNTTPFLKTTDHLVNFGVAISGGNCSIFQGRYSALACGNPICQTGGGRD